MSKEFYISDLHFSHANAINFDNRPWKDINEMNEEIIRIWNERVTDEDDVWILGDISWANPYETRCLIARLRGKKHWVTGNHDYKLLKNEELCRQFVDVYECYHKHIDKAGNTVVLSHFPIFMFDGVYHGHTVHLYERLTRNWLKQPSWVGQQPLNRRRLLDLRRRTGLPVGGSSSIARN